VEGSNPETPAGKEKKSGEIDEPLVVEAATDETKEKSAEAEEKMAKPASEGSGEATFVL
jgi:hypothetical protein